MQEELPNFVIMTVYRITRSLKNQITVVDEFQQYFLKVIDIDSEYIDTVGAPDEYPSVIHVTDLGEVFQETIEWEQDGEYDILGVAYSALNDFSDDTHKKLGKLPVIRGVADPKMVLEAIKLGYYTGSEILVKQIEKMTKESSQKDDSNNVIQFPKRPKS